MGCSRCLIGTRHSRSSLCQSCSATLNKIIGRWLQSDRDQPNGEFANALGITRGALEQRVTRIRRGAACAK